MRAREALVVAALSLGLSLGWAKPAQAQQYIPRDECQAIPGAMDFRRMLNSAVVNRHEGLLFGLISEDVQLDFGGGEGHVLLREMLNHPAEHSLWPELEKILRLGCSSRGDQSLVLPWYWGRGSG